MSKKDRKYLKKSTCDWNINYPKVDDLQWKIKRPGEIEYELTNIMPYEHRGDIVDHNATNVNKVEKKYGIGNLESFFNGS
jgi:hypothetical protein